MRSLAIVVAAVSLSSCKGESFPVVPCEIEGQLAFKLGKLGHWFGIIRSGPEVSSIWLVVPFKEALWRVNPDLDASQKRRTLIRYGQELEGTKLSTPAKPLTKGVKYRVQFSTGPNDGMADFTYGAPLPQCSAVRLD